MKTICFQYLRIPKYMTRNYPNCKKKKIIINAFVEKVKKGIKEICFINFEINLNFQFKFQFLKS